MERGMDIPFVHITKAKKQQQSNKDVRPKQRIIGDDHIYTPIRKRTKMDIMIRQYLGLVQCPFDWECKIQKPM